MEPLSARELNSRFLTAPDSCDVRQSHLTTRCTSEQDVALVTFADRPPVARVLAWVATAGRGVDAEDLRHAEDLAEFSDEALAGALAALVHGGHLECRKVAVRYRVGDQH